MEQETLEEAAERIYPVVIKPILDVYDDGVSNQIGEEDINEDSRESFIAGAKSDAARDYWFEKFQQEQDKNKYSEEEVLNFGKLVLDTFHSEGRTHSCNPRLARIKYQKWFEQFSKLKNG